MSPARRRALVALGAALVLVVGVVVGAGLRARESTSDAVSQSRPGAVLLVPGYGGSTSSLQTLADALTASGRRTVVVQLPGDGTGDLRAQAAAVKAAADGAIVAGAPSVDVVGYSAGGVVARIWAADLGGAAQARRIVTLGSPHHGTELAGLGSALAPGACPLACRQLVPGSDVLTGLPETPSGPVWTSLWTTQDQTVVPPDSARLEGALDIEVQSICPDASVQHGQLPRDPLVIGLVEQALDVAPMTQAPAPSRCAALRARGGAGST
ncbi:esterase/lipase family protein [Angustibacter sp. McL0619]|uniref:esterase/lipase family protein n=1 Tax=Angustibacter sp. McL0619 TaxID=3415676 RepID=UPI003CF997D7